MRKVPKLRFKEFSDEWEEKKLGEISEIKGGYAFKSNKFLNTPSKYQVIKMGNLYQNKLLLDRNPSFMEEINEKEKEYLLKKDDIILTLTGTVGKKDFGYSYKINNENNLLLNQRLACIKMKHEKYSTDFFKDVIKHESFLDEFFELSIGGTGNQANVSIKDIENIKINIPIFSEQQKIANFLSSVDKKISLTEEKLELFKEYKKGVMQKIFSQELRFKDSEGNDYPEWEEKKLEEIAFVFIGLVTTMTSNYVENGIPMIRNSDILPNKIKDKKELIKLKINFAKKNENRAFRKGDIVTVHTGDLGTSAVINENLEGSIGFATLNTRILNKNICYNFYLSHFFNSQKYKEYVQSVKTGDGRDNLNLKDFIKSIISLPILEEQQKIADFLSSIDTKIENIEKELENLKEFKKGLLQQMFV